MRSPAGSARTGAGWHASPSLRSTPHGRPPRSGSGLRRHFGTRRLLASWRRCRPLRRASTPPGATRATAPSAAPVRRVCWRPPASRRVSTESSTIAERVELVADLVGHFRHEGRNWPARRRSVAMVPRTISRDRKQEDAAGGKPRIGWINPTAPGPPRPAQNFATRFRNSPPSSSVRSLRSSLNRPKLYPTPTLTLLLTCR